MRPYSETRDCEQSDAGLGYYCEQSDAGLGLPPL